MQLNKTENEYYETLKNKVANAPRGISFAPAWLFDKDPVSPRICARFFQDVTAGLIPNVRRNGRYSRNGYTVI